MVNDYIESRVEIVVGIESAGSPRWPLPTSWRRSCLFGAGTLRQDESRSSTSWVRAGRPGDPRGRDPVGERALVVDDWRRPVARWRRPAAGGAGGGRRRRRCAPDRAGVSTGGPSQGSSDHVADLIRLICDEGEARCGISEQRYRSWAVAGAAAPALAFDEDYGRRWATSSSSSRPANQLGEHGDTPGLGPASSPAPLGGRAAGSSRSSWSRDRRPDPGAGRRLEMSARSRGSLSAGTPTFASPDGPDGLAGGSTATRARSRPKIRSWRSSGSTCGSLDPDARAGRPS